jgi:localization factor PodJL
MAYGYSRGARGYGPDPRDVIEDAAREAGVSVQQWLDRALADDAETDSSRRGNRSRRAGRDRFEGSPLEAVARRIEQRGARDGSGYSDDRVERIVQDAMETIRANEERTASALETLERRIEDRTGAQKRPVDNRVDNRVLGLIDNIERGMNVRATPSSHGRVSIPPDPDLIGALEQKISNVVDLIEQRSRQPAQTLAESPQGQRRDLRSHAAAADMPKRARSADITQVERQLALLGSRMDALMHQSAAQGQTGQDAMSYQLTRLQQDIARLSRPDQTSSSQDILLAIRSLGHKLAELEQSPIAGAQFERLMTEIAAMRAGLQGGRNGGAQDFAVLERHFESLENRLEAITDKVMTMRVSGVRDLRGQKSVENAIEELKQIVRSSATPSDDNRVLGALQALERRLDAMERAPQESAASVDRFQSLEEKLDAIRHTPTDITSRLDHLQSLMAERPAAAPLSASTEMLLGNLAERIETLQQGSSDDQGFERLHKDIQALSRKLEETPAAQQVPAMADISGLERSISDLFRQLDGLKSDIGTATEHAVRRAATDVLSKAPVQTASSGNLAENVQVQRSLSDIHVAQQEAERRTSETLGAVHDTLQKVVGRLVDMEKDMKRRDDLPPPVLPPTFTTAAPQTIRPALQPLQNPPLPASAPRALDSYGEPDIWAAEPETTQTYPAASPVREIPFAPPSPGPHSGPGPMPLKPIMASPLPPLGAHLPGAMEARPMMAEPPRLESLRAEPPVQTNAFQDTVASVRAQRMGVSAPVATEEAANRSALASAFAAAKGAVSGIRLGKVKSKTSPTATAAQTEPHETAMQPQHSMASTLNDPLDLPLEPGSGRPDQGRNGRPETFVGNDPKTNFLTAARRAAQTAAAQSAEALNPNTAKGKTATDKAIFGTKASLNKKHVLLLGLAALIVAVGATVQFTREPEATPQPRVETPSPRKTTVLERAVDRLAQATTGTPPVVQPRQILPPTVDPLPPQITAAKPDDRILSQPPRQAQGEAAFLPSDPATVGALGQEAGKGTTMSLNPPKSTASTANDPLFRFEGIREAERLKAAARNGDPAAFIELGTRYLEGKGAPRDPKAAALWFERAADFGSAPAQYRLGALYREGRGVERNARMALKYFQTASDAGNARAMHNTAVLLAEGVNGSPDYSSASEWFKKASEFGIRDSQYNLAILYARGLGVSQDLMASYAWFAAAAANGDEDAAKKRDEVGARLSGEKLQQAKTAATAWKAKTPDPAANEVNVPAGGWDAALTATPAPTGQKPKPART